MIFIIYNLFIYLFLLKQKKYIFFLIIKNYYLLEIKN